MPNNGYPQFSIADIEGNTSQIGVSTGRARCLRFTVPDEITSITLPSDAKYFMIRNSGDSIGIRFNFDDDDENDYFTLRPFDRSPVINVLGTKTLNLDGLSGSSSVEIITWG